MIFLGEQFRNIRLTVTNIQDVLDLINKIDKINISLEPDGVIAEV